VRRGGWRGELKERRQTGGVALGPRTTMLQHQVTAVAGKDSAIHTNRISITGSASWNQISKVTVPNSNIIHANLPARILQEE